MRLLNVVNLKKFNFRFFAGSFTFWLVNESGGGFRKYFVKILGVLSVTHRGDLLVWGGFC